MLHPIVGLLLACCLQMPDAVIQRAAISLCVSKRFFACVSSATTPHHNATVPEGLHLWSAGEHCHPLRGQGEASSQVRPSLIPSPLTLVYPSRSQAALAYFPGRSSCSQCDREFQQLRANIYPLSWSSLGKYRLVSEGSFNPQQRGNVKIDIAAVVVETTWETHLAERIAHSLDFPPAP